MWPRVLRIVYFLCGKMFLPHHEASHSKKTSGEISNTSGLGELLQERLKNKKAGIGHLHDYEWDK